MRLSIIVATKDRYETLFKCIEGLLINYNRQDVEIIVRDNSFYPKNHDFQTAFKEHINVFYHYDGMPVSQSENYELALEHARGKFVTMIGDDDGIAGGLMEVLDWMERNSIDSFSPGHSVYLWPGVHFRLQENGGDGLLEIEQWIVPKIINADAERYAVLSQGCTSLGRLPRLYYGIVNRKCIDRVKKQAGQVFPGPSPDMANAFSLSYTVSKMAVAQLPIFIAGNSRQSNAGLGLQGRHVGEIKDLSFLPRDTAERWNSHIPFFWSGQTIWCQSAYTAAEGMGRASEFASANNYRKLYAKILVWHPRYAGRLKMAFLSHYGSRSGVVKLFEACVLVALASAMWIERVQNFLRRKFGLGRQVALKRIAIDVRDVKQATRKVDEVMKATTLPVWLDSAVSVR